MEEGASLEFIELSDAVRMCYKGEIEDPKLEIGFRRLASYLGYIPELSMWAEELPEELKKNYDNLNIDFFITERETGTIIIPPTIQYSYIS